LSEATSLLSFHKHWKHVYKLQKKSQK